MNKSLMVVLAIFGAALLAILLMVATSGEGEHEDVCKTAGGVLVKSRGGGWVCVKTIEVKT